MIIRELRLTLISELLRLILWLAPKPKTKDDTEAVELLQSIISMSCALGARK